MATQADCNSTTITKNKHEHNNLIDGALDNIQGLQQGIEHPSGNKNGRCIMALLLLMTITLSCSQLSRISKLSSSIDFTNGLLTLKHSVEVGDDSYRYPNSSTSDYTASKGSNSASSIKLKLALLLSFPNSGTSYTLKNTRRVSNTSTASNYCGHNRRKIPVFPADNRSHHVQSGPHIIPESSPHMFPLHYILTKTHCFHCSDCLPSEYLMSTDEFQDNCLTECAVVEAAKTKKTTGAIVNEEEKVYKRYPLSTVGKFVHLFRNPFDNIVSRFHLNMKHIVRDNNNNNNRYYNDHPENIVNPFNNNVTGFHKYCKDQDSMFDEEERNSWKRTNEFVKLAKIVPCHADWFRFIAWHNHVFEMSRIHSENIQTFVLHYDDYQSDLNGTVQKLLLLLNMSWVQQPPIEFYWNDYSEYYTETERQAAINFVRKIASNDTLREIARYGF